MTLPIQREYFASGTITSFLELSRRYWTRLTYIRWSVLYEIPNCYKFYSCLLFESRKDGTMHGILIELQIFILYFPLVLTDTASQAWIKNYYWNGTVARRYSTRRFPTIVSYFRCEATIKLSGQVACLSVHVGTQLVESNGTRPRVYYSERKKGWASYRTFCLHRKPIIS